jgi:hypothetical protein
MDQDFASSGISISISMLMPVRSSVQQTSACMYLCVKSMSLMMLLAECILYLDAPPARGRNVVHVKACTMTYMNTATCVHYHMASTHGSSAEHMYVCKERRHERRSGARAHCTSGSLRRTCKQPSRSKARRPFLSQTTKQPCVGGVQKCKYVVPPVAEYLHVGEGEDKRRQRRGKAAACLLGRQKGSYRILDK